MPALNEYEYDDVLDAETSAVGANEYDAQLQLEGDAERQDARLNLYAAARGNPDEAAAAKRLSISTGLPAPVIERNLPQVTERARLSEYDRALESSPALAAHVAADRDFAKMARDELPLLAGIANSFRRGWRSLKQMLPTLDVVNKSSAIAQFDAIDAGETDTDTLGTVGESYLAANPEQRQVFRAKYAADLQGAVAESASRVVSLEVEKRAFPAAPVVARVMQSKTFSEAIGAAARDPLDFLGSIGPESLVTSLPGLVSAIPASVAGGPLGAAGAIGAGSFVTDYSAGLLGELSNLGIDVSDEAAFNAAVRNPEILNVAIERAGAHATVVGAVDALSGGLASKFPNLLLQLPLQSILGASGEAGGTLAAGNEIKPGDVVAEAVGELFTAPVEVAATQGHRVRQAVKAVASRLTERRATAEAATQNAEALAALSAEAAASKLRARDVPTFEQFIERAVSESGAAPDTLYVEVNALADALDAAKVDPATVPADLAAQIAEAALAGGDVTIRTAEFAAKLAGTPVGDALLPHLRTAPEGMSAADAQAFYQSQAEQFAQDLAGELAPSEAPQVLDPAQMTPEQWAEAQEDQRTALALEKLDARTLRDMRWMSNAKAAQVKELKADAAEKRKAVRVEAAAEVSSEPLYAAMRFIKRGELERTDLNNAERKVEQLAGLVGTKLSTTALREMYGEGGAAPWRYLPTNMLTAGDGMHPDEVAKLFGYASGDALVRALIAADPIGKVIEARIDQRMLERFGDITDPRELERRAEASIAHEARARTLAREIAALNKTMGFWPALAHATRAYAEQATAQRKIRDLRPSVHVVAEARAQRNADTAWKSGDTQQAARFKREQLLSNRLTKVAASTLEEVERGIAYLKKFDTAGTRKAIGADYSDQIEALLERFDLRKSVSLRAIDDRKSLLEWVKTQEDQGLAPVIDDKLLNEARRVHYRELTVADFRNLVDAVKNIEHLGRLKQRLLTAKDRREFAAAVAEAEGSIRAHATKSIAEKIENDLPRDRLKNLVTQILVGHRKVSSLVRQMDGGKDGGVLWELLVRPMNAAGDFEASQREKAAVALAKLFAPIHKLGKLYQQRPVPGTNLSLSRAGRLAVALNWGNAANRQRVLDGQKWSPSTVQTILDTLTKEEWDFVQGVFDFIDSYWPAIQAKEERVAGVAPEKVEALTIETKFGTIRGGYYPIAYDPSRSSKAEADTLSESVRQTMQGLYTRATTRRGHTKARVESVERPLKLDIGVVFKHVDQVIHDLAWHEYLIDANRLLAAGAIDAAIREHYGAEVLRTLKAAVKDMAAGEVVATNGYERAADRLRRGSSIAALGWNLSTAALQPLGLTQSMVRVGPKWIAKGIGRWLGDAARMENTAKTIYARSEFMRLRGKTMQREIAEIRNKVEADGSRWTAVQESFYYLIQKFQLVADIPTWLGAYEKAIDGGEAETRAAALADQAVLDSQGGGQVKDLAGVQRGGSFQKLWTGFYSFFNTAYNLGAESYRRTNFRDPASIGRLAVDWLLLYSVPAVLGALLKDALKGGDDDEELAEKLVREQIGYLLGTMVGLRELGSAVMGYDYGGPAATRIFAEITKFVQQAEQGEIDEALLKRLNNSAGILLGYPAGQVQRTLTGLEAVIDDDAPVSAIFFGPPPQ